MRKALLNDLRPLFDYLLCLGIPKRDVLRVYLKGSALYVSNPRDLDLTVILANAPRFRDNEGHPVVIGGMPLDVSFYSVEEWNEVYRLQTTMINEVRDYTLAYSSASRSRECARIRDYADVATDESLMAFVLDAFRDRLFYYKDGSEYPEFQPKRLMNFFVLARKDGSVPVTQEMMDAAHEGLLNPKDYREMYSEVRKRILSKIRLEK